MLSFKNQKKVELSQLSSFFQGILILSSLFDDPFFCYLPVISCFIDKLNYFDISVKNPRIHQKCQLHQRSAMLKTHHWAAQKVCPARKFLLGLLTDGDPMSSPVPQNDGKMTGFNLQETMVFTIKYKGFL